MQPHLIHIRAFNKVVDGGTTRTIIALCQGEPVGSLDVNDWHKPGGWLSWVNVEEKYRRQGIARRMLERAIKDARKELKTGLGLAIVPTNTAARTLYESLGFRVCYGFDNGNLAMTIHL